MAKNGCQAFEIKLRPSRRREAATVTTIHGRLVVAKRLPSFHRRDAKRRQRPSRRREAATAMTSSPRRLCRRREVTTAEGSCWLLKQLQHASCSLSCTRLAFANRATDELSTGQCVLNDAPGR